MIPKRFFITHSSATSEVSDLNAFDRALINACIAQKNHVTESTVIPIYA